jgi:hypothetical protein
MASYCHILLDAHTHEIYMNKNWISEQYKHLKYAVFYTGEP